MLDYVSSEVEAVILHQDVLQSTIAILLGILMLLNFIYCVHMNMQGMQRITRHSA